MYIALRATPATRSKATRATATTPATHATATPATNTLPLPPKRWSARKYSLPGIGRHTIGSKSDLVSADADTSCLVKSDNNNSELSIISELESTALASDKISLMESATDSGIMCNSSMIKSHSLSTVSSISYSSRWNPRFLKHNARPLSLDLTYSYSEDEAYMKSSTDTIPDASIAETIVVNELPLPPRCPRKRPLRGTRPPPRHLLGPKPAKYLTNVGYGNIEYELPPRISPIAEVDMNEPQDDVRELEAEDVSKMTNYSNIEDPKQNGSNGQYLEPRQYLDCETTDRDHEIVSNSSADTTVVTAIEVNSMQTLNVHTSASRKSSKSTISTDTSFDLPMSDIPLIDPTKLSKDIQNTISKESQRSTKNLAAEITDFFKTSASKLKPPCLQLKVPKKDSFVEEIVVINIPERDTKVRRLIPRSPYIAPVKFDPNGMQSEHIKQPPFIVWNVNSKNAATTTSVAQSKSLSPIKSLCETKEMKNMENATRKKNLMRNEVKSDPTPKSGKESEYAENSSAKPDKSTLNLVAKNMKSKSRMYLAMNDKAGTKLPAESLHSTLMPFKDKVIPASQPSKNQAKDRNLNYEIPVTKPPPPKVIIPIPPPPPIVVRKVKTQLPCDFPSRVLKCINKSVAKSVNKSTDKTSAQLAREKAKAKQKAQDRLNTQIRYIRRLHNEHEQRRRHAENELFDLVNRHKPDNTWPPKKYHVPNKK